MLRLSLIALLAIPSGLCLAVGPPPARRDVYGDPLPRGAVARLGSMRLRHLLFYGRLALSHDGSKVASLGEELRVWDRATGQLLGEHRAEALSGPVVFLPGGRQLLFAEGSEVLLWDLRTGRRRALWKGGAGQDAPHLLALSGDGKALAVCCDRREKDKVIGRIYLVDVPSGKARGEIALDSDWGHSGGACFAPGGRLVVASGKHLRVWDVARRKELGRVKLPADALALALSPDGKSAAVKVQGTAAYELHLIDLTARRVTATATKCSIWSPLGFRGDGKEVMAEGRKGEVVAIDPATGKQARVVVPAMARAEGSTAFSGDGRWVVRSDWRAITVCDARTGKPSAAFADHRDGSDVEAVPSPDGRLVATRSDSEVRVWELETGRMLRRIAGEGLAPGLSWSADGRQVAVGRPRRFAWHDAASGRRLREIPLPEGELLEARLLPGGRWVSATVPDQGSWLWCLTCRLSAADGKEASRLSRKWGLEPVSEDGGRVLRTKWEGDTTTLRVETADGRRRLWERDFQICQLQGRLFLSGRLVVAQPEHVEAWDVQRGRRAGPPADVPGELEALAVSPDGRTLVLKESHSVEAGGIKPLFRFYRPFSRLHFLEIGSGQVRVSLLRLPTVTGAAFTRDGRRLVTSSEDGTAMVWDVASLADRAASSRPWDDLASSDARVAFAAVCALARSPREAVGLLAARLPADRLDAGQVRRWIDDLDAESFARRRGAERRLAGLGVRVEGDLFDALKRRPSLEARQRLGRLLDRTEAVGPEALRLGRAIEALERIGSGQAVRLLQRLAQGHTGGRTTREAREALARLRRGPGAS